MTQQRVCVGEKEDPVIHFNEKPSQNYELESQNNDLVIPKY